MLHPSTKVEFISPEKGYGVIATEFIPKGTVTWCLDELDRVFTPKQVSLLTPQSKKVIDTYCFRDKEGDYVLCWDLGRFVNHSSNSNCLSTAYDLELAIRDIHPGEELTDDYGYLNLEAPFECLPENEGDRTTIYPDDLLRYHDVWDAKLLDAFVPFSKVNQPLKPWIPNKNWVAGMEISLGKRKMESIINCYFAPTESRVKELKGT